MIRALLFDFDGVIVAVPSEITRAAAFPKADLVLASLADRSLEEILQMLD